MVEHMLTHTKPWVQSSVPKKGMEFTDGRKSQKSHMPSAGQKQDGIITHILGLPNAVKDTERQKL